MQFNYLDINKSSILFPFLFVDLVILTAMGTAAVLNANNAKFSNLHVLEKHPQETVDIERESQHSDQQQNLEVDANTAFIGGGPSFPSSSQSSTCSYCHIPSQHQNEIKSKISRCNICKRRNVPEFLLTTVEPPADVRSNILYLLQLILLCSSY
jgi:hypothetical protein